MGSAINERRGRAAARLALLLFVTAPTPQAAVASELEASPLRPPDTSSPRATLSGFLDAADTARQALIDGDAEAARIARRRGVAALDFSDTTNGFDYDERTLRLAYLSGILDRIALPPLEDVPGREEIDAGGVSSWMLPDTEIVIRRVDSGEREGQFVFSAASVARLHRDYRRVRHLPFKTGLETGIYELIGQFAESTDTIAARVRAELKPVEATSPRVVVTEFLRSVNEAHDIVMAADEAARAGTLSPSGARDADRRATRLIARAARLLDLSEIPDALRGDAGKESVLLLKEVLDRAPLPSISAVPGERGVAQSGSQRWVFPNTELEVVPLSQAPGTYGFSAATVSRIREFYERVDHLPYRGEGSGYAETRFQDDFPDATVSPGFYEYYIRTPGALVPGASWLGRYLGVLPESFNSLFLGQTIWQWLTLLISLLMLAALLTGIYLGVTILGRHTGRVRAQWVRLLAPLAGAYFASRYVAFLDQTVNLTGEVNATSLVVGTAFVYLFLGFAVFRIIVAVAETLAMSLRKTGTEGDVDELDPEASSFDTSLMRVVANSLAFVAAVAVFVSGVRELGLDVVPLLAGLGVGGLAVALAVRPTLENMIGGVILYADRPIHVGDYCKFGENTGVVERIGLRSTRIRARDRTIITVPNSVFADMQITNFAQCDKMLINTVIGLRYETTPEQLRRVLARMRQICFAHPKIETDTLRVRFGAFGASSLDLNVRVYALVTDWNDFHAVREDLFMRFMEEIEASGTGVAFPSTTVYLTGDDGLDPEKVAAAEQEVAGWREAGELPFPRTPEPLQQRITDSLDYPPRGSPEADGHERAPETDRRKNAPDEDGSAGER